MRWFFLFLAMLFAVPVRGLTGEAAHLVLLLALVNLSAYQALSVGLRGSGRGLLVGGLEPGPALLLGAVLTRGYTQAMLLLTLVLLVYYLGVGCLLGRWFGRWAAGFTLLAFASTSFLHPWLALLNPVALMGPAIVQASAGGWCYTCSHSRLQALTSLPVLLLPTIGILLTVTQALDFRRASTIQRHVETGKAHPPLPVG